MKKLGKLIISVVLLFAMGSLGLANQIIEPGYDNPPPRDPLRNICDCR